jgi:hypothetical protein
LFQDDPGVNLILSRQFRTASQNLFCRLGYTFSVGVGEKSKTSEKRDEMIGNMESAQAWTPKARLQVNRGDRCIFVT